MYSVYTTEIATRMPATKKMGPNDATRVVWAISEFFFLFFICVYVVLTYT